MTFNGIHLLVILVVVAVAFATIELVTWHKRNEYRKVQRLVHRNLWRIR